MHATNVARVHEHALAHHVSQGAKQRLCVRQRVELLHELRVGSSQRFDTHKHADTITLNNSNSATTT